MSLGDLRVCLDARDVNQFLEIIFDRDMLRRLADSKTTRALRDDRFWDARRDEARHSLQFDMLTDVDAKDLKGAGQEDMNGGRCVIAFRRRAR